MHTQKPTLSDIRRAHRRINRHILRTPILTSHSIDNLARCEIHFKCENFQKVGSFKMRGAANAVFSHKREDKLSGFATHSSGNHAQALALACKLAGTRAYVVMPNNTPNVKKKAVREYGAEIIFCEPDQASREETCREVIEKTGAKFIHPFDDTSVIAGQATAAKELIEDGVDFDMIMTPVGGGGLGAGTALAAGCLAPAAEVILAEPENVNDAYLSLKNNRRMPATNAPTVADGLRTALGKINFDILKSLAVKVQTVSEEEIISAMKIIWERMKIIVEPSCAVPLAAVLRNRPYFEGKKIGIILTGGNVDLENLPF